MNEIEEKLWAISEEKNKILKQYKELNDMPKGVFTRYRELMAEETKWLDELVIQIELKKLQAKR